MHKHRHSVPTSVTAAFATLTFLAVTSSVALSASAEASPITAEPLTGRAAFSGDVSMAITQQLQGLSEHVVDFDDASHTVVVRFTIGPGAVFPWHTHPGMVLINIVEGEFVFLFAEDCARREYGPGSALIDPGNTVHTSYNPSSENDVVVMATLIGVPAEGSLTIPVDAGEGAALDEKCGIERDDNGQLHAGH